MSLYDFEISNKEILGKKDYRWKHFCLDINLLHRDPKSAHNLNLEWENYKFSKENSDQIPEEQGIYMFVLNIEDRIMLNGNSKYILYIGQTTNLNTRYKSYFRYVHSDEPSDFLKKCMILIWGNKLDFHYFETNNVSNDELNNIEFDLIDAVIPPFNIRFRCNLIKKSVKLYSPR